jgi:hypothetical protein
MAIGVEVNRQFLHLVEIGSVAILIFRALVHHKRHQARGVGVGADDKHLGFTIAGHILAPVAVLAQVSFTHRCSVLHVKLAHNSYFLIRERRKVIGRGTSDHRMFSVALPLSYRDSSRAGIEPATTGFEVSVTYATGQGAIQKNIESNYAGE